MVRVEDFENLLKRVLESEIECKGILTTPKGKITIYWEIEEGLSRKFKFIYINFPERVKSEDITLNEGERIKPIYKEITPDGEDVVYFMLIEDNPYKNILWVRENRFEILVEKGGGKKIDDRALEIIKSYFKNKYQ